MSVNSLSSNTTNASSVADQVFQQIDANKDGQLSATEFGSFLTNLLGGLSAKVKAQADPTAASTSSLDLSAGPQPFQPIACRYVFAGFCPDNHLGETPTVTAPKYAVYNVLANLANGPSFDPKNFAPQAAADLQQMFGNPMWQDGQPLFRAIDGETIGYGDEYVHYAPTGYGLQAGTYNPEAPGEFFWGYTG
jgi:hypothetical protein